jgi:hypothetical protein
MLLAGLAIVALYIWATELVKRQFFSSRESIKNEAAT